MSTSGNRDHQLNPKNVLKNLTNDALIILADSLFQKGTAQTLNKFWRWRVLNFCSGTYIRTCAALDESDG